MGGRAAHQLPQSVLLSLHVPAEARPRLKARTRVRKSIVSVLSMFTWREGRSPRLPESVTGRFFNVNHGTALVSYAEPLQIVLEAHPRAPERRVSGDHLAQLRLHRA